ncbi:MAG TPA: FtsH protease activity modulator HflK [Planctomycetaceae bacterium]|nr:FtsH protease activity modulator HflK [Planctomycetaceae bacterium]
MRRANHRLVPRRPPRWLNTLLTEGNRNVHRTYELPSPAQAKRPVRWLALLPWLAVAYAATGVYSVGPGQLAVVRRCGRMLARYQTPGLHFGFPWPIDRVDIVDVTQSKRVSIGWNPRRAGGTQPASAAPQMADVGLLERTLGRKIEPQQAECLTGDRNIIIASAIVQYRISDPGKYLFRAADLPALIRNVASSALARTVAGMKVDDVLTLRRVAVQNEVMEQTQERLDRYDAGMLITSVSLEGTKPPDEVADAFRDVTAAREDRQRMINEAEGYASQLEPKARGEAARIRLEAEAYARQVVEKARGDADRFIREVAQLRYGRQLTVRRLILETAEEVLPRLKKVILDRRGQTPVDLGLIEEKP